MEWYWWVLIIVGIMYFSTNLFIAGAVYKRNTGYSFEEFGVFLSIGCLLALAISIMELAWPEEEMDYE